MTTCLLVPNITNSDNIMFFFNHLWLQLEPFSIFSFKVKICVSISGCHCHLWTSSLVFLFTFSINIHFYVQPKRPFFFFFLNVIFISIISVCLILWYEKIDWKIHESSFHSNFIIGEVKCKRETQRKQKIVLKKTFHNHMGIVPLKLYISVYLCPFSNCLCVLFFF